MIDHSNDRPVKRHVQLVVCSCIRHHPVIGWMLCAWSLATKDHLSYVTGRNNLMNGGYVSKISHLRFECKHSTTILSLNAFLPG